MIHRQPVVDDHFPCDAVEIQPDHVLTVRVHDRHPVPSLGVDDGGDQRPSEPPLVVGCHRQGAHKAAVGDAILGHCLGLRVRVRVRVGVTKLCVTA